MSQHYVSALCLSTMSQHYVSALCLSTILQYVAPVFVVIGRIDRKIEFPLPDEKTRRRIFQIHTKKMTLANDLDLEEYITAKDDLSGADIKVNDNDPYSFTQFPLPLPFVGNLY